MKPAGFENGQDIISANYIKDPGDPQWKGDPGMNSFDEFLAKYFPEGNRTDNSVIYGFSVAQTMEHVLRKCGDDLTRENVMKQAASVRDFAPSTFLPGIKINTSATDFAPVEQLQLMKFKGERWELFGDVISGELGG
jgi:branched-chain amino acid transport system substrate-binding protein